MKKLIILLFIFLCYFGMSQTSPTYQNITIRDQATIRQKAYFIPTVSAPAIAHEGMLYADTDHHLYYYDGTSWVTAMSNWTLTGNDIENNNAGTTTIGGGLLLPDLTPQSRLGYILGHEPTTGNAFPVTLRMLYDSTQQAVMSAPSVYTTWVKDTTNNVLYPATETDKIKEIQTKERVNTPLITFQFDDARDDVYSHAYPLFELMNEVACTNVITDSVGTTGYVTWAQLTTMQAAGWEILNHSSDTTDLYNLTIAEAEPLVSDAKDTLNARGFLANNFVFPQNSPTDSLMAMLRKYHRSARAYAYDTINIGLLNTYCLSSYNIDAAADTTLQKSIIDSTLAIGGWCIMYMHDVASADTVQLRALIRHCQNIGISIVTVDQALDIIGNQIDLNDNFSVKNNEMVIGDRVYVRINDLNTETGHKYKELLFHRSFDPNSGGDNLFFGTLSGNEDISPAGGAVTLASYNHAFGDFTLQAITKGYNNTSVGFSAAKRLTEGYDNTFLGYRAGDSLTTGYRNILIGSLAGRNLTDQLDNVFIGANAGKESVAQANVYIGTNAGVGVSGSTTAAAVYNTAIGMNSLAAVSSGDNNTAVGYQSLLKLTSNEMSTAFGSNAAYYPTGGYNTMLGAYAGYGVNASNTSYTTAIGYQSMYGNNGAIRSVAVGALSGYTITTGDDNTYIGFSSGYSNSTGARNTFLGYRGGYWETGSNKLYITNDSTQWANAASIDGLLIYGDYNLNFVNIFNRLAIGQAKNPTIALDVVGSGSFTGYLKSGTGTIANNDSIPDVSGYNTFIYNGTANSVAVDDLTNPVVGAYYTFIGNSDTYTLNFPGSTNFKMSGVGVNLGQYDNITFYCQADNVYIMVGYNDITP